MTDERCTHCGRTSEHGRKCSVCGQWFCDLHIDPVSGGGDLCVDCSDKMNTSLDRLDTLLDEYVKAKT